MRHTSHKAPRRGVPLGRAMGAAAAAVTATLVFAAPAAADVQGPCDGQVTIDGVTYGPDNDSSSNPVVVPADAEVAQWRGTTGVPITDHTGEVRVMIGPAGVRIADWGGENAERETTAEGSYAIAEARADLPIDVVGLYEVSASHSGTGGTCSGSVMVRIEGAPLSTPVGAGAAAATVLGLAGLAVAGAGGAAGSAGAAAGSTASGTASSSTTAPTTEGR